MRSKVFEHSCWVYEYSFSLRVEQTLWRQQTKLREFLALQMIRVHYNKWGCRRLRVRLLTVYCVVYQQQRGTVNGLGLTATTGRVHFSTQRTPDRKTLLPLCYCSEHSCSLILLLFTHCTTRTTQKPIISATFCRLLPLRRRSLNLT